VAQGFKDDVVDPSVFVKMRLLPGQALPFDGEAQGATSDAAPTAFLIWTTTPWTLPANAAVALKDDAVYALAELGGERYVLHEAEVAKVLGEEARVLGRATGRAIASIRYEPLYPSHGLDGRPADTTGAHRALVDETVLLGEGTGIVHIAPAYGDLEVGRRHGLPVLFSVDLSGTVLPAFASFPFAGLFFKKADPKITRDLEKRGLLLRAGTVKHSYPFCWRCDTALLYFAKTSWYLRTTARKERMLALNATIGWTPPFIGEGRFGDWLRNNVDWALSRERYWGTPLPFWRCAECGAAECVGSVAELERRAGRPAGAFAALDLHRPAVDDVELDCAAAGCGGRARRVPEVADAWFDSGAMPYAQNHFMFETDAPPDRFPCDFISEAVDQTRGWFYSLHALATMLYDSVAYKNCVVLGHILDGHGQKMSKSKGNVVDPWTILDSEGSDALRWYCFTATPPWQPRRFSQELVRQSLRAFLLPLWNVYSFYVTYGNLELEALGRAPVPAAERPRIDRWVLAALHALVRDVTAALDAYDVTGAGRKIEAFVEELSTWYVRRNRERFWRRLDPGADAGAGGADRDKLAAYQTLEECLVTVARLLAPFTPFVAEELWQNLVRGRDAGAPASVHHADFPVADPALIDDALLEETEVVQNVVAIGRSVRAKHELKTRQPLAEALVAVPAGRPAAADAVRRFEREIKEELNVESLRLADRASDVVRYSVRANIALLGKKLRGQLPAVKAAILAADAGALAARVQAGEAVTVSTPAGDVTLAPEEIEVLSEAVPGFAAAEQGGIVVALATEITPELRQKGIAREVARNISELRKGARLAVEQTIHTQWATETETLKDALERHAGYVMNETLSGSFTQVALGAIAGPHTAEVELDEGKIALAIRPQ